MDIILHNNDILIPLDGGVISGTITEAVNEFSSLSVKLLPSCIAYDLISPFITHLEIIEGEKQLFYGRVLTETPSMSNSGLCSKSIICEDRMAYLCDSIQPYTETRQYSGDSQRNGLQEFVDLLLENHNSQVEEYKKIYRGNVTLQTHETTENVYKGLNYETTWEAIKSKLLDVYGGEMRVREADGKLYLDYAESLGVTRSTKIEVGKNMQSAERTLNPSAVVSRLIPLGAKLTQSINIIPYFSPTVNSFSAERADTTGLIDDEGEYMAYKADYSISDINNLNSAIFQIQYKQTDATEWNVLLTETEFSNILSGVSEQEILNADETFNVRFMVQDFFGAVYFYTPEIPSAFTLVDYDDSGKGISFGGVCREKGMHTFLPTTFYDTLQVKNENTYKIFFAPGDTFTLTTSSFSACAYITSSAHDLIVQIPVLKPICASSVTAEGIIIARGVNGYINGKSWETADISLSGGDGYTVLYTITDTGIVITFTFDNTITNATNNTPVAVTVKNNVTFTFS